MSPMNPVIQIDTGCGKKFEEFCKFLKEDLHCVIDVVTKGPNTIKTYSVNPGERDAIDIRDIGYKSEQFWVCPERWRAFLKASGAYDKKNIVKSKIPEGEGRRVRLSGYDIELAEVELEPGLVYNEKKRICEITLISPDGGQVTFDPDAHDIVDGITAAKNFEVKRAKQREAQVEQDAKTEGGP